MTNRMTNVQALTMAIEALEAKEGFSTEALEKLGNIRNTYVNKSSSNSERKPTKTQLENEGIKAQILDLMDNGTRYTATEISKMIGDDISVSRTSALLRQLRMSGTVERTEEKGRAYFTKA